jgi:Protein of unknown function (DUF2934)
MAKPIPSKNTAEGSVSARPGQAAPDEPLVLNTSQRDETIAKLAYQLWLERGSPDGSPEEDWFRAEQVLDAGAQTVARPSVARPPASRRGIPISVRAATGS